MEDNDDCIDITIDGKYIGRTTYALAPFYVASAGMDCQGTSKRDIDGSVIGARPYDTAILVACPMCGAEPGEICITLNGGRIREVPHIQRRNG